MSDGTGGQAERRGDPGSGEAPARAGTGPEEAFGDAVGQVAEQLAAGDAREAVRLFLKTVRHKASRAGLPLREAVTEALGAAGVAQLITGVARYPCFGCQNGYVRCEGCDGTGVAGVRQACRACAGLGRCRCDFCNATGLAPYSLFPDEFWADVAVERARVALSHLKVVTARAEASAAEAVGSDDQLRHDAQRALDLNKLLGVLENAVQAAGQAARAGLAGATADLEARLAAACAGAAGAGEGALVGCLRRLADGYGRQADLVAGPEAEAAADKAELLTELAAAGSLVGTPFGHPFLIPPGHLAPQGGGPDAATEPPVPDGASPQA